MLGHADFEAQNLRWHGREVWAVHDWDSLAWQPEAALAGAASRSFASAGPPTLAPIESSESFLLAYQDIRGRMFTVVEQEIAWAASVWMAAYNAREMALRGYTPVGGDALLAQAPNVSAGLAGKRADKRQPHGHEPLRCNWAGREPRAAAKLAGGRQAVRVIHICVTSRTPPAST